MDDTEAVSLADIIHVLRRAASARIPREEMTMAAIENYHGKPSLEATILTAYLSGDLNAVREGLGRLNRSELNILGEACEELSDMAYEKAGPK